MSLIKNPSEMEEKTIVKVLIYGDPGKGKSTLALSAPKPLLLDFEGGSHRVNAAFRVPTVPVRSWSDVLEIMKNEVQEDGTRLLDPFDTIVVDTVGSELAFMEAAIIQADSRMQMRDGSLSLKGYGARAKMFQHFLDQCQTLGKNLVCVAHGSEDRVGEQRTIRPDIGGKSRGDLIKGLDWVGYLTSVGTKRVIYWEGTDEFYAKRNGSVPPVDDIPVIVDDKFNVIGKNNFLTKMIAREASYRKEQGVLTEKYNTLLEVIEEEVAKIVDVDTANACADKLGALTHIWNSKLVAGTAIKEKCNTLGFVFDKITKKYVAA